MRVLHCIDNFNIGGIQDMIFLLHKHDRLSTHDGWGYRGTLSKEMQEHGFVLWEGGPPLDAEYDVLVGHGVGGWSYDSAFRWARERGMKTVECMHSVARSQTSPELTDAFVGVSKLATARNTHFKNARTIYPIVDVNSFSGKRGKYIGRVSRVAEEKMPHVFAALSHRFPSEKFLLCGDGPYMPQTRAAAATNVEFAGMIRDFPSFYEKLKLFVFPTKDECNCVSVAMAQAAGIPVICQDIPALRESTGGYAWFASTPDDFARAISRFLSGAEAHPLFDAQQWVKSNYDVPVAVAAWNRLFSEICQE